jgi:hypothetical protein
MNKSFRKRSCDDTLSNKVYKRTRVASKGINSNNEFRVYIPLNKLNLSEKIDHDKTDNKIYTHDEVVTLLSKQEQTFRTLLEEKLREQFNMFNQLYIDNIFNDHNSSNSKEMSYIT